MSILIDRVRISGFRGLSNIEINLPRTTLLIGTNNSGKTSIIKALQLALGDYARYLAEEDFHIDKDEKQQDKIIVDLRFVALDESGNRAQVFEDIWLEEFQDKVQSESNGNQFVAIRTVAAPDKVKGGYLVERFPLKEWPDFSNWTESPTSKANAIRGRLEAIPFIGIDAQRDIHNELKDKSSYIGKVLSSVEYEDEDVTKLEEMVAQINKEAIDKSEPLKKLKYHLDSLNQSFEGAGQTELAPFPKKIRDLSKRFSVHFGETEKGSFSMEYHGMGTRSWASMLTVKAFSELMAKNHEQEAEPYFPILAAEEPEAHLHPNAQRTLYRQLIEAPGQVIISTHSPYLAAMADIRDMRGLIKKGTDISVGSIVAGLDSEDFHILQREIMRFRGELLFARCIILFEGVTEEQLVPAMFEAYFGYSSFSVGVNCISVSGKNYPPFIKLASSFGIPIAIVSDNDGKTKQEIESQIAKIRTETGLALDSDEFSVGFLSIGNDIEAELLNVQGLRQEIIDALIMAATRGSDNSHYVTAKTTEINALNDSQILEKMRASKASYAGYLSDILLINPYSKPKESLVPESMRAAFEEIRTWMSS
ncbi:AAA family ATPase [Mariprofundus ferrooxydans]|uniref:AAA family ATPase n=1 Tax=Mariprofundus ferrooxydans TaxID=314344 RepID=UPI0014300C18|nr:AAA family ATPase [Mariprofundus ferrooxydans]